MIFEQFYLTCLSHASYMIGSEGEAAVVDPQRDVDIYLRRRKNRILKSGTFLKPICMPILFPDTKNLRRALGRKSTSEHRPTLNFLTFR